MVSEALLGVCVELVAGLGRVLGGSVELTTSGDVENTKVVWGVGVAGLQAETPLSMVPLAPQRAEMQPPVPSLVW